MQACRKDTVAQPAQLARATSTGAEVVLPIAGGTAVIDGVSLTMVSNQDHLSFAAGQAYYALADFCASGTIFIPHGEKDIFAIAQDGTLTYDGQSVPLTDFNLSFRTLDRLTC
jgi:hypothetical protein